MVVFCDKIRFSVERKVPRKAEDFVSVQGAQFDCFPRSLQGSQAQRGLSPCDGALLLELFELLESSRLFGLLFGDGVKPLVRGIYDAPEVPPVGGVLFKSTPASGAHFGERSERCICDVGGGDYGDLEVVQGDAFPVVAVEVALGDFCDVAVAEAIDHKVHISVADYGFATKNGRTDCVLIIVRKYAYRAAGDVAEADNAAYFVQDVVVHGLCLLVDGAAGDVDSAHRNYLLCSWGSSPLKGDAVWF